MIRREFLKQTGLSTIAIAASDGLKFSFESQSTKMSLAAFNQVGFAPARSKSATILVQDATRTNNTFQIYGKRHKHAVFEGRLNGPMLDEASGDHVAIADFSAVKEPGLYRLIVQGKPSGSFKIGDGLFREPLRLAMRSYYGQRCGCDVDLGGGYKHPKCHMEGAYHPTSGRDGALVNSGGWHDAGDYGRYIVNCGISCGTLLWTWELYPQRLRSLTLDIPESGGKTPDYLAEVRWNLEWMLSLQDWDGGVWHKQTSEQFCGFVMPQDDHTTSYVIGTGTSPYKSTCATADLAAVMAIAARCYSAYDAAFTAHCLSAARRAWDWAIAHPDVPFANPKGIGTGGYDDKHCNDAILWASAELWRTTGEPAYETAFLQGAEDLPPESAIKAPSWPNVAPMAHWTYGMTERKPSAAMKQRILKSTSIAAQSLIDRQKQSGYGNTLALTDYIWGSNGVAANQSLLLLIANHMESNPQAQNVAFANLDYLLGRNCFGVSWVTQVGINPFQHPHHRPSIADGIDAPWPGLLSGGPNAHAGDAVARTLPKMPPMRMWLDHDKAYSLNEVAINWNAPLIFLLAAVSAQEH